MAIRKRGRPTTSEMALERDRDLEQEVDVKSIRPGAWRKTPIRHPEYLNGVVYSYRVNHADETLWNVRYPDAPGGLQDYEINGEEFQEAIECYKGFMERASQLTLKKNGA
jgi:hypothetical protein